MSEFVLAASVPPTLQVTNAAAGCARARCAPAMPLLASTVAWLLSPPCLRQSLQQTDDDGPGHAEQAREMIAIADSRETGLDEFNFSDGRGLFIAISPCAVRLFLPTPFTPCNRQARLRLLRLLRWRLSADVASILCAHPEGLPHQIPAPNRFGDLR